MLANVADEPAAIPSETVSGLDESAWDLIRDSAVGLGSGLVLPAHAFVWLRVRRL